MVTEASASSMRVREDLPPDTNECRSNGFTTLAVPMTLVAVQVLADRKISARKEKRLS